jgi:3-oxoacyl-[acyl-carrier protein] reductase
MILTRELMPLLSKAGASSIVNMSSIAGRRGGGVGSLTYATSKGAIITWTRALAAEAADRGIRVNAVAPGLILGTAFHETHSTKEAIENTIRTIPLQRAGIPEDVSRAVLFLASEFDGFITGVTMDINGGIYMA